MRQVAGRWYPPPPMWLEGRAWLEYGSLLRDPIYSGQGVAPGEGRPVMLVPGFLAGDMSLDVLRGWLRRTGYHPMRSGIDLNVWASETLVRRISERLLDQFRRTGRKATIIGQSRGGSLGFVAAQRHPELVEQVVALGSPLADPLDVHPTTMAAVHLVRALNTVLRGPRNLDVEFDRQLQHPPRVPVTVLYSRTDGVVHWKACVRDDVDAIEVGGSHVGMGVNPRVYREVARLLA
jgi:triacylglycerol lipase